MTRFSFYMTINIAFVLLVLIQCCSDNSHVEYTTMITNDSKMYSRMVESDAKKYLKWIEQDADETCKDIIKSGYNPNYIFFDVKVLQAKKLFNKKVSESETWFKENTPILQDANVAIWAKNRNKFEKKQEEYKDYFYTQWLEYQEIFITEMFYTFRD